MSAHSAALAPARGGRFGRQARLSTGIVVGSIAVAGAIAVAAAAVGMSHSQAAPLAGGGGTGRVAPLTSSFERAVASGSASQGAGTAAMAFGPSSWVVQSATTGLNVRIPSAESPMEQAVASQPAAVAPARTVRVSPVTSPLEQAVEAAMSSAPTVVITDTNGFVHRVPLR